MEDDNLFLGTDKVPMLSALHAPGPFPDYADKLQTFGRLVGAWDVEDTHFNPDGTRRYARMGEWHFGWVLEGRAIQDVILSPPRDPGGGVRAPSYEYGTTVRFYDPEDDLWHVTFVAPVARGVVQLVARPEDSQIVLTGTTWDGKPQRWVFSDISPERFTWRGYEVTNKRSWFMEEEILAWRRTG